MKTLPRRWTRPLTAGLLALGLGACGSMGPEVLPSDQFNYNAAIAQSIQEQLLTNLIRLRYNEPPVFLRVSSVISQRARVMSSDAAVGFNTGTLGDNTAGLGGRLAWTDRPTITYVPVAGQEFSRNLLTPLPPRAMFEMAQAGWPTDLVLGMTTWSVNGLENDIARPARRRQAEDELLEFFEVWQRLRESGVVGVRTEQAKEGETKMWVFVRSKMIDDTNRSDADQFYDLLGLDRELTEFPVRYGLVPDSESAIAVLTGSLWDIMLNLAWQLDVPSEHIESGRTTEPFRSVRTGGEPPIRVRFSEERPLDAFVAVEAQGLWFYIHEDDRNSKRVLSFVQLLLNLAETTPTDSGPVVTISS